MTNKIPNFYKKTSCYTDLGMYNDFIKQLPNNIEELCILQRMQTIHPIAFKKEEIRNSKKSFWGDMTAIPNTVLLREDDIFPTSISMIAEILRKNSKYSLNRESKDKLFITCRGQAILLAATLKAKNIPARVRSGFAEYPSNNGIYWDHWITEYYNDKENRWILIDADCCCNDNIDFDIYDIPQNKFLKAAQVYLEFRKNPSNISKLGHAYYGSTNEKIIEILTTALFYDFHCLMNDEIIYLHYPKYLKEKNFKLETEDFIEIDELAKMMLEPETNFDSLMEIWNKNSKFRIMTGGTLN